MTLDLKITERIAASTSQPLLDQVYHLGLGRQPELVGVLRKYGNAHAAGSPDPDLG